MKVETLSRAEWGTDPSLPRRGHHLAPDERSELVIHHTVTYDDDPTPNVWESVEEIAAHMRRLQRIRPDLGLDVPYNLVVFLLDDRPRADLAPPKLVVCEGRGWGRTGAHASGHNRSGFGLALVGNFEDGEASPWLEDALRSLGRWLCAASGSLFLPSLAVLGHRDTKATACPGRHVYERLDVLRDAMRGDPAVS